MIFTQDFLDSKNMVYKANWAWFIYPVYGVVVGDILVTVISVYCDSVKKRFVPQYVFRNTCISAISGNHRLSPLTA